MARLSERQINELRKQTLVLRSELQRELLAVEARRVSEALSWVPSALATARWVAPLAALTAPILLRRKAAKPARRLPSARRIVSGALLGWRLAGKLRPLWARRSSRPE